MNKKTVRDVEVAGKRVLVRADLNVALDSQGQITDDSRLRASLDTLRYLIAHEARVIILSHMGRPNGQRKEELSLRPVADALGELLGQPVEFLDDCVGEDVQAYVHHKLKDGQAVLLENLRFHPEEEANSQEFAKQLADLGELYVNDAFGTAHRAHASTEGIAHYRGAVAGLLMESEIDHLGKLLESPARPFTAILGGSKVSTKVGVIHNLLDKVKVDHLLLGGGMTFAFLKAQGKPIGNSRVDDESLAKAKELVQRGLTSTLELPDDIVVTDKPFDIKKPLDPEATYKVVDADKIPDGWEGVDIGPGTIKRYSDMIWGSQTVVWNGPLGVFEIKEFATGTYAIAKAIASSDTVSVVGGGESVAAVRQSGFAHRFTWVSTGGGASLEFLEGLALPGVTALEDRDVVAGGATSPRPSDAPGNAQEQTTSTHVRTPFIAGNWKMNGEGDAASALARDLRTQLSEIRGVDVAICPPLTALASVAAELSGSSIHLGAQDMFWKDSGAYTGKISGPMLKSLGCTYVILGHSECRGRFGKQDEDITDETVRHFGDTNATVALKLRAALRHGLGAILCVGETLAERDAGSCDAIVDVQVHAALHGLQREDLKGITIAYEPVWAIGTGQTCDAAEANRVCGVIRGVITRMFGEETAQATRIQYGGSVTAHNAQELLSQPEIDGALVGGQSLKPEAFARIAQAAQ